MITNTSVSHGAVVSTKVPPVAAVDDSKTRRLGITSRNIKLGRIYVGLSQRQLACRLGRDQRHVSEWERGKHEPGPRWLEALACVLEQEEYWFIEPHPDEWDAHGL